MPKEVNNKLPNYYSSSTKAILNLELKQTKFKKIKNLNGAFSVQLLALFDTQLVC